MSALDILYRWCCKYGIPQSIYSDRHSTYKVNEKQKLTIEEELSNLTKPLTGFGKVCQRLNIKQIFAYSAPAKGRVERKHNLYKDRYIKELRFFGINTLDKANEFLLRESGFVQRLNNKFTIEAKSANSASISLVDPAKLAQQFTMDNTRIVRNDYTVQLDNVVYQLSKKSVINSHSKVLIKQDLQQQITIWAGNTMLDYKVLKNYIRPLRSNNTKEQKPNKVTYVPPVNHPFRKYKPEKNYSVISGSKQLEYVGSYYG
jgi:hypothetical protein